MSKPPIDPDFAFDPTDQSKTQDFELMAKIRRECPIVRPTENVVLTTRYEDTALAFRDGKTFSAVGDMRAPGVVVPLEESFMGELDAPLHTRIRKVFARVFTRRGALEAEGWTRDRVRQRLADLAARDRADLMKEFAMIVPGSVAAHVMGIPEAMHDRLMGWCADVLHSSWPATGRTERGEGLAASFMLGNLLHRLLTDTEFEATLRREPAKIPTAVDESLRLEAPVTFLFRRARHDTAISGCPILAGEQIMLGMAAANRDESVYPDADQFRLDRDTPKAHLAFGLGPHVRLGNHLTWMIGRVVLEEFLARFAPGQVRLVDGFEWQCVDHIQEYGPDALPVEIRR